MERGQVFVATSAYGASDVQKNGQAAYVSLVAKAGADGIEIRRELLREAESSEAIMQELKEMNKLIGTTSLKCAYSVPSPVFEPDGSLNRMGIRQAVSEAVSLGAWNVKFSLGRYLAERSQIDKLQELLVSMQEQQLDFKVMVENDQTPEGGRIEPLLRFFQDCAMNHVPIGMTFDIGNWLWTGEDATLAAERLAPFVEYVHTKQAVRTNGKCVAIPLQEEQGAAWRDLLAILPSNVPRTIEFPLGGQDVQQVTRHHVELLRADSFESTK